MTDHPVQSPVHRILGTALGMAKRVLPTVAAVGLVAFAAAPASAFETAAKYAILMDYQTGRILLDKNADISIPPASMSKLMTVYMLMEQLEAGNLKLEDTFPVSAKAWKKGGSKMFVRVNTKVAVRDLMRGIIVQSGNDASIVVAESLGGSEEAFARRMTDRAREIGLKDSSFANATGWPDPGQRMSVHDIARLSSLTIRNFPQYYPIYSEKSFTYNKIKQGNRNPLLYRVKGTDGLKTGHTEEAGYGLAASAEREGRRLILVVAGLDSKRQRADESERLMTWGFREFQNLTLFKAGEEVEKAPVWLGVDARLPLVVQKDVVLPVQRSKRDGMKVEVVFEGPIPAPIKKGTPLARLIVRLPDEPPMRVPLVAGADVDALGPFGKILAVVEHMIWGQVN